MKQLEKYYNHDSVEQGKMEFWSNNGYFSCDVKSKKPSFSVVIPPPNVTGVLHIGHAKNTLTIDTLCRYKRLRGYDVLFLPAMDHAGIATQAKVEANLREQGIDKYQLGKEKFLDIVWQWKEKCGSYIHKQWDKIGLSVDKNMERFTLDEKTSEAVNLTFKKLYDEGLIYQGERIINWDPKLMTALSNIEVEHKDIEGKFYYFKYHFASHPEDYLTIATTRPETMFGDTAIVYNPHDERYKKYDGEMIINPVNGEKIPFIADRYVDKSFGTGVMKCTPAHDPHDFEIGKRHNFEFIKCMNLDGTMNERALKYNGLDRFECRDKLVEELKEQGDLVKIEDIVHSVGHSERSHCIIEPMLSKQWFVKMKPLALKVFKLMKEDPKAMKFFPSRYSKIFTRWLKTVDDWCISRQLWWGHKIPVYTNKKTGEKICSITLLNEEEFEQDQDVLDTWFSSALAPFAFLNWPDKNNEYYKKYYPNSVLVTAYDIIFFWVARMVFQGSYLTDKLPFHNVFIHGLIRDEFGKKMSKSSNNGVDPIKICEQYGVDALRYAMANTGTPGLDCNIGNKTYENVVTFLNKVWNASRYVLSIIPEDYKFAEAKNSELSFIDKYIYHQFNLTLSSYIKNMDKFELGQATKYLYDFVYNDFCGTYLELCKIDLKSADEKRRQVVYSVLYDILKNILIMLFPNCPFICEEIYWNLPNNKKSIYEEDYPSLRKGKLDYSLGSNLVSMIRDIRAFKTSNNLPISAKIQAKVYCSDKDFNELEKFLKFYLNNEEIIISSSDKNLIYYGSFGLGLETLASEQDEEVILRRIKKLEEEVARSEKILGNENFLKKAPKEKIELEKEKYLKYKEELEKYKH